MHFDIDLLGNGSNHFHFHGHGHFSMDYDEVILDPSVLFYLTSHKIRETHIVYYLPDNLIPNMGEIAIHFPPMAPENLSLANDEPNIVLSWSPVTEDIVGNTEIITNYRIYRNFSSPNFEPNLTDLLSTTENTTFTDYGVMYNYPKAFYKVTAVSFLSETTRKHKGKMNSISVLESSPSSTSKSFKKQN